MKVAILGSSEPVQRAVEALEQWGAQVLTFCPQEQRFWVQKRALSLHEQIPARTRFHDPFRVVYEQAHSQQFLQELEKQEGAIPGFSEDDMAHLLRPVENFVDVDVVVDGVGMQMSAKRAPLLGERNFPQTQRIAMGALPDFEWRSQTGRIALVLEGEGTLDLLESLGAWAQEGEGQLAIVGRSFTAIRSHSLWRQVMEREQADFERKVQDFEQRMAQWKALEDYLRAKHPRPAEPQRNIELFEGYYPISIDYLSDCKQGLLSIERPDFRGGEDLRTLNVAAVIFGAGLAREADPNLCRFEIAPQERGYLTLNDDCPDQILDEVGRLFSRKDGQ